MMRALVRRKVTPVEGRIAKPAGIGRRHGDGVFVPVPVPALPGAIEALPGDPDLAGPGPAPGGPSSSRPMRDTVRRPSRRCATDASGC